MSPDARRIARNVILLSLYLLFRYTYALARVLYRKKWPSGPPMNDGGGGGGGDVNFLSVTGRRARTVCLFIYFFLFDSFICMSFFIII